MAQVLRIVVAEDHEVVRRGVRDLLSEHAGWEVVKEARTGRQALEAVEETAPDVVVLDLSLPELSGIDVIRRVHAECPRTVICVFSLHEDERMVGDAIAAGARAYVGKSESAGRLVEALEALERHEVYFSPRIAEALARALVRARCPDQGDPSSGPITDREREVTQLLVQGLGTRAVAMRLGIAPKTVDTHRAAVMRKLGLTSMADLVRYAIRNRLTEP